MRDVKTKSQKAQKSKRKKNNSNYGTLPEKEHAPVNTVTTKTKINIIRGPRDDKGPSALIIPINCCKLVQVNTAQVFLNALLIQQ